MDELMLIRQEIDSIDEDLIELLSRRFLAIEKIGKFKKLNNIKPLQTTRWQEVLEKVKINGKEKNLNPVLIGIIWNTIHEFAIEVESRI